MTTALEPNQLCFGYGQYDLSIRVKLKSVEMNSRLQIHVALTVTFCFVSFSSRFTSLLCMILVVNKLLE